MRLRHVLAVAATLAVAAPAHADPLNPLPVDPEPIIKDVRDHLVGSDTCVKRENPRDDIVPTVVCAPVNVLWLIPDGVPPRP